MKYKVCHAGYHGSEDNRFVKLPENAIVVGPHTIKGKLMKVGRQFFGLLPEYGRFNTPGIMYLIPMEDQDSEVNKP